MIELNLHAALPEIWIAVSAMVLLLIGAYAGDRAMRLIGLLSIAVMVIAIVMMLGIDVSMVPQLAFGGHFIVDTFGVFAKVLALIAAIVSVWMSFSYAEREGMARFELPLLMLLATLGMMLMVSANDLISLYVGLELQSLALYVTAAIRRDTVKSTEAGLKYFVLGALSSGMLLYGASMIYGFVGTVTFAGLSTALSGATPPSLGLVVGLVFLCAGLAFKISAVPFHMWTPDVYEGAPTPITAFFAAAPKVAAIALFTRVLVDAFGGLTPQWQQIIFAISVGSMILGAFAAMGQRNIKRLMAYSSIGNIGYALVGLAAGTPQGVSGLLFYMATYVPMTLGSFAVILAMRQKGQMVEEIADLSGLAKSQPWLAHIFAAILFSMAGIPPLVGFFGKWMVFAAAVDQGLFVLAVIGVVTSVVSAYYYVRIIKVMYFDEAVGSFDRVDGSLKIVLAGSLAVVVVGILFINPIQSRAIAAAASLFPGMSLSFRIEQVAEIDSTNEACRLRALAGEAAGLVIRADRQTAGRGRRGRNWSSPPGNLYTSILLRPQRPASEAAALGFAAVMAIGDVAEALLPPGTLVQHKWPNDLLIDGSKASGILLEAQPGFVVLGIGVNIASHPADTPYPATDLVAAGAAPIAPQALLERLLTAFAPLYESWERAGFAALLPAWRRRAAGLGQPVEVRLERETLTGTFRDLEPDGTLRLTLSDGTERRIAAGDVYLPAMTRG